MAALDDELLTLRNALSTARARVDFLEKQGPVAAERQIRLEQAIEKLVFVVDRLTAAPADQDILTKTRRQ
jgi:methylglyoxal synthase